MKILELPSLLIPANNLSCLLGGCGEKYPGSLGQIQGRFGMKNALSGK
jgi:hypothetical protein